MRYAPIMLFALIFAASIAPARAESSVRELLKIDLADLPSWDWQLPPPLRERDGFTALSRIQIDENWNSAWEGAFEATGSAGEMKYVRRVTRQWPQEGSRYKYFLVAQINDDGDNKIIDLSAGKRCDGPFNEATELLGKPSISNDRTSSFDERQILHLSNIDAKWELGQTHVVFNCIAASHPNHGGDGRILSVYFWGLTFSSANDAKEMQPIAWLKCPYQSQITHSNGTVSASKPGSIIVGVDFDKKKLLNQHKNTLAEELMVTDVSVVAEFPTKLSNPDGTALNVLSIGRIDGALNWKTEIPSERGSATAVREGHCEKANLDKKVF